MYKAVSGFLSLILIIFFAACGKTAPIDAESSANAVPGDIPSSDSSIGSQVNPPDIDLSGEIAGEITVSAYDTMTSKPFLEDAARLFMEKYPGTAVSVETFSAMPEVKTSQQGDYAVSTSEYTDDPQARRDYINRLNTELMSGGGADVLSMDVLPVYKYARSGQLENLAGYMAADPGFNRADYRANILEAVEYEGGLWFMPLDYAFDYYSYDSTLITGEAADSFGEDSAYTFGELMSIAEPLYNGNEKLNAVDTPSDLFKRLLEENYASFVDLENNTANFTDGSFEALLNLAARYGEDGYVNLSFTAEERTGRAGPAEFVNGGEAPTERVFFKPKRSFDMVFQIMEELSLGFVIGGGRPVIEEDDKIAGIAAFSGGRVPFICDSAYGINANSGNKPTAWAFIKFLLSEELQLNSGSSSYMLPVLNSARAVMAEALLTMYGGDTLSESQEKALADAIAGYNETVERMSALINSYVFEDAIVSDMIAAETGYFFEGGKTAAQVAEALQSKVGLYLNE